MEKSKLRKTGMALALAIAAALTIYTVQAPADAPQYLTATAERSDIENAVLATGLLEGVKQVDVGAQVSSQLKSLKVKVGDKVKKGQWLAEIDPLILQNTLRKAQVDEENLRPNAAPPPRNSRKPNPSTNAIRACRRTNPCPARTSKPPSPTTRYSAPT